MGRDVKGSHSNGPSKCWISCGNWRSTQNQNLEHQVFLRYLFPFDQPTKDSVDKRIPIISSLQAL